MSWALSTLQIHVIIVKLTHINVLAYIYVLIVRSVVSSFCLAINLFMNL